MVGVHAEDVPFVIARCVESHGRAFILRCVDVLTPRSAMLSVFAPTVW